MPADTAARAAGSVRGAPVAADGGPFGGPGADIERLDRWERLLARVLLAIPFGALLLSVVLGLAVNAGNRTTVIRILVLGTAAGAWLLVRIVLDRFRPARSRAALRTDIGHFVVLWALIVLMNLVSPFFGFFAFGGYLQAIRYLRGPALAVAVAATAFPIAYSQTGGVPPASVEAWIGFAVILVFDLMVVGVMVTMGLVGEAQAEHFRRVSAELAGTNARLTETLLENAGLHAQLVHQAHEAGAADERQRLAREIHDTIAQGLTGIVTQLQAAEQAGQERQRHLDNAARLARDSLVEARRAVSALRPVQLQDTELPEALADVVAAWRELQRIPAELTVTGRVLPLHPEVEVALLRAAQESLANVAKHAGASRVGLTLSYMGDVVTLDVRDDGRGFDPAAPAPTGAPGGPGTDGGYGLGVMRQRLQRLAGSLEIESEPGSGTAVCASAPAIPREEAHV